MIEKASKSRTGRKLMGIIVCAVLMLSGILLFSSQRTSASPDVWTEWEYDDFTDSAFGNNIVINGVSGSDGNITLTQMLGWYDMEPGGDPGRRYGFGFAFDGVNNVAVLFGGYCVESPPGVRNDTWEYDYNTNSWTEINDGSVYSPPPREMVQMDYDSANEVIVLWGGVDAIGAKYEDTWEYDVNTKTWAETTPKPSPPGMGGYALAYESVNNKILMSGTNEPPPGGVLHMWAYDTATNTWTERTSTPYPRGGHDMAFKGNVMVVQGGQWGAMGDIHYDDTLVYNYATNSWTRYDYEGDLTTHRPGYRVGNAMARYYNGVYDVNGYDGFLYLESTWNFTSNDYYGWVDETPLFGNPRPVACRECRLVFDTYHKVLILYGGSGFFGPLNETWVYAPGYAAEGFYVSKWNGLDYFDSGGVTTEWKCIWWNYTPANQPPGTKVKFQLQTGNVSDAGSPDPDRTLFIGPDGTTSTYYETPGATISSHHRWNRYIRYQAFMDGVPANTPVFDDITICYESAGPPFIIDTIPVNDEIDVDLTQEIIINFNEPMNTGTVTWDIIPNPGGWTETWSPGDQTLTLNHSFAFTEGQKYMVTVTAGKDLDGLDLIDPYDKNPWNFTAKAIKPYLTYTNPYDGETGVEVTRNIIVEFSESMNHNTVDFFVSPSTLPHPQKSDYTVEWGSLNTTLFLNHTTVDYQECQMYTAMITDGVDLKGNPLDSGEGVPNPWTFTTYCDNPYVASRDPEHATQNVPTDKNIIITFSEQMNTGTVAWLVSTVDYSGPHDPTYGWSEAWESGDTVLNISHSVAFLENKVYYVNVTDGEDMVGLPLNRQLGLAAWWFRTGTVDPWIEYTDPSDGQINVNPNQPVYIKFSEAIDSTSFLYDCFPDPLGWSPLWDPGNAGVTLSHNPFTPSMPYTFAVTNAQDMDGNPLDPSKGAPNPWTFTTSIAPPGNLRILRSPPDIVLNWNPVVGATEYYVYESQVSDALWSLWNHIGTVTPPDSAFAHSGAHTDGLTHFYIVRAWVGGEESPNSTMGVKIDKLIQVSPGPQITDINWLSLPFNSVYKKASDIALELGPTRIRTVGKWDASKQKAITRTYAKGKWRGKDFSISPGEGVFIAGIQTNFNWVITGTDLESTLSFTYYAKFPHNINWISIPYTGIYDSASSVIIDIEGGLGPSDPSMVIEIGKWDPMTQSSIIYKWDGISTWIGTDFSIAPGDRIYIEIISSFPWPVELLTPVIP